jgi:hypothetical protein
LIGDPGPLKWSWRPASDDEAFVDAGGSTNVLSPWPPHTVSGPSLDWLQTFLIVSSGSKSGGTSP